MSCFEVITNVHSPCFAASVLWVVFKWTFCRLVVSIWVKVGGLLLSAFICINCRMFVLFGRSPVKQSD